GEDGNIPASAIAKVAAAISSAVGLEFAAKERYNARLEEIETTKQLRKPPIWVSQLILSRGQTQNQ
nr:hypothetical protein [Clostridiales bacterium]